MKVHVLIVFTIPKVALMPYLSVKCESKPWSIV